MISLMYTQDRNTENVVHIRADKRSDFVLLFFVFVLPLLNSLKGFPQLSF